MTPVEKIRAEFDKIFEEHKGESTAFILVDRKGKSKDARIETHSNLPMDKFPQIFGNILTEASKQ